MGVFLMKAVHFGAGNIGRGFIGELLFESGFETTFIDVVQPIIDYINASHSYEMYVIDNNYEKKVIKNVKAVSSITDEPAAVEAICEADIITTSVCVDNLDKIAPTLAKGLKERLNRGGSKVNVMACENAFYATDMLKKALVENKKAPITEAELDEIGAFPNVAVDRIALCKVVDGVKIPQIQSTFELVIEKDKMVDPTAQPIKGAEYVENLGMYLERKLYVFNCGHAATAYFGYYNNRATIFDALEVPEIKADVIAVMKESAMAMTKKYPFTFEELEAYIEKIIKRISLEELHDEVVRVGRSPIRKLNAKDRLVGPALLAEQYGLDNSHLAKAIAAGYAFDCKDDEQAVEIQNYIAENGIEKAVEKYSSLTAEYALYQKVIDAYKALKA